MEALEIIEEEEQIDEVASMPCDSTYREKGNVYEINNKTMLWGGTDSLWHFDITDWSLSECNLHYGLGRETFPALLEPQYVQLSEVRNLYDDNEECIIIYGINETKVYPYKDMIKYEAINEVIDGNPVMIAYCVLADLAAVYTREYCDHVITFAVSGYTYHDNSVWDGLEAFILWDRETESLWWPLNDVAVSGSYKDTRLEKYNTSNWEVLTMENINSLYPDALILKKGQTQEAPQNWKKIEASSLNCN